MAIRQRTIFGGVNFELPVAAGQIIEFGNSIIVNSNGYVEVFSYATANRNIGIALQSIDNSTGANGDLYCDVNIGGVYDFAIGSLTNLNLGQPLFSSDGYAVSSDNTNRLYVGIGILIDVISGILLVDTKPIDITKINYGYLPIETISTNTVLNLSQCTILVDSSSNTVQITFPNANTCLGKIYHVKVIDKTNLVTIISNGGTIDGETSYDIDTLYTTMSVQSDGANWWIL